MSLDQLTKNYPALGYYFDPFIDSNDYILSTDGDSAEILIKSSGDTLKLSNNDLQKLSKAKKFKKPRFYFIDHCGFQYSDFGEICITVFRPEYSFIDEAQEWYAKPLKFKISTKLFNIGPASPLFVLINEPIYRDSDLQYDFQNFATIKVSKTNIKDIKDDIIKAMYYLNSFYLKPIGFVAKIYQMKIDYDAIKLWDIEVDDIFKKLNRVRTRTRFDFISLQPLNLYNKAQLLNSDEKFLLLYRILEFFMDRARIRKISDIRFNKNVSDILLIKTIDKKNEEMLLQNLLNEALSINQKKRISRFAFYSKLISEDNYQFLSTALYKYRNSIVHAKEQQILDTKIPNPFDLTNEPQSWIYIVDDIVQKCIRKYNKPSG